MIEAGQALDFRLCGPLQIRINGELAILRPNRLHEILALLLWRANTPVAVTDIGANVWPDKELTDDEFVRPYISRIRKLLSGTDGRLATITRRYYLEVDPMRIDVLRFEHLTAQADHTDDPAEERRLLDEALEACPTDNLLSDFTRTWAHTARTVHQSKWRAAALRRNGSWLRDGLHEQLVSVLRRQGYDRSSDQRWAVDYLLALYRSGHVPEAKAHHTALSRYLQANGIPLQDRLRSLGEAIRCEDPSLSQSDARAGSSAPNTLPPPVGGLAGRRAEIQAMRAHASSEVRDTVRVIGIYGSPGIGKTTLATAYAHAHAARYPGGVLFSQLRMYGTTQQADIDATLGSFLLALGIRLDQLPAERSTRLARYRDLARRRPMLVVLDNVAASDEVADLLPTAPGSLAIVTSRVRLTTLTSRYGALPVVLGPMDDQVSVTLLTRLIGASADRSSSAVRSIASACRGHPLALCLVGARIATRPEDPLADVAATLAMPGPRIPVLDRFAEAGNTIAEVFGWSYRSLEPLHAQVFRTLGLSPGISLDLAAAACLTGLSEAEFRPVLTDLGNAHLVTQVGENRHTMLDLLAEYAGALAVDVDPPYLRREALDRLYTHHRESAGAAARCLFPSELRAVSSAYEFDDPIAAREWLDDHCEDLIYAARHEAAKVRPRHVVELAGILFRYLDHGGRLDQATTLHEEAVRAARRLGDEADTARALGRLGAVLVRRGPSDSAHEALMEAYTLYERLGDRRGQAIALGNLGRVAARRGALADAETYQLTALDLFRSVYDRLGEARTLTNVGIVCEARGELVVALSHHEAAKAICTEIDAPDALARALGCIAGVLHAVGQTDNARRQYEVALERFQALGDRVGEATTLTKLGLVTSEQGQHDEARRLHEGALAVFNEIGDRGSEAETLNNLGAALLSAGRSPGSLHRFQEALNLAQESGDLAEVARAHCGLAAAYVGEDTAGGVVGTRELTLARQHALRAGDTYDELGLAHPARLVVLTSRLADD